MDNVVNSKDGVIQSGKRINYIDAAKGIGIILVCIGHAVTNASSAMNSTYVGVIKFIAQFHMPLFFLLSGLVFSERYAQTPFRSTLKKIKAYYYSL